MARTARGIWVQNKKQPLTPKQGEPLGYPLIRAGASEVDFTWTRPDSADAGEPAERINMDKWLVVLLVLGYVWGIMAILLPFMVR